MKAIQKLIMTFPIALLVLLFSCQAGDPQAKRWPGDRNIALADTMDWITGTWAMHADNATILERWSRRDDSTYTGTALMVKGPDTTILEEISLARKGDGLFYTATVNGQNGGRPVDFRFTGAEGGRFVFENPGHDFPQRIIYSHPDADSLVAVIEGTEQGSFRTEVFRMARKSWK